jgi:hypothetical protein
MEVKLREVLLCWLGFHKHKWDHQQEVLKTLSGKEIVVAWKQCYWCAESKLIHILM